MSGAYGALEAHFGRIGRVRSALGVLHWDMATMMPSGGAETRAEEMATLEVIQHELTSDPRVGQWLDEAGDGAGLEPWQRANLGEMRRLYLHATALDSSLVEALSKAASSCEMVWRKARPANDFKALAPKMTEIFRLTRLKAQARSEALGLGLYDALLDEYEPGGSSARIDGLFDDLAAFLPGFTDEVLAHQARRPAPVMPEGPFPVEKQRQLGLEVMETLGFDFDHGRLDVSHHPFCGGAPDDVRITTRYNEADFFSSLMGVIHETGHALYERGLPTAWRFQPVGAARGMSMHESQSLLMEMQASRSRHFLEYLAPRAREIFGGSGAAWEADNLFGISTTVERSLIRVDADEVTYPAHVILRYRLEKALLHGELEVEDLPGAWREGMRELVGIEPPDDRNGCMQDIHWVEGIIGYFPTYTLGAMSAAQLFQAACAAHPAIPEELSRGEVATLLGWLRQNVHGQGSSLSTDELMTRATGRPLDAAVFRDHLRRRYLEA